MADIYSILQSNYVSAGSNITGLAGSKTPYVAVDAKSYEGTWNGAYADGTKYTVQVSNVVGFRAKVRYQSGSTLTYQDVLIKDSAFKFGNSKFTLAGAGKAQIKTVLTNAATGAQSLETSYATQN